MSDATPEKPAGETAGRVVVRYWAAARAAAGVEQDVVDLDGETTLAAVLEDVRQRHVDRPKFKDVVTICSILIGDRPVGNAEPDHVAVRPGDTVELLPPFAGG
jgi:sulfur-carrier protein